MIQIHAFKEKRKERNKERSQLDDLWKVSSSMALKMFHVW
jgi:hypothetical protein